MEGILCSSNIKAFLDVLSINPGCQALTVIYLESKKKT
jgi:hypothetical protein